MKILLAAMGLQPRQKQFLLALYEAITDEKKADFYILSDTKLEFDDAEHIWQVKPLGFISFFSVLRKVQKFNFDKVVFFGFHPWNSWIQKAGNFTHTFQLLPENKHYYDVINKKTFQKTDTILCQSKQQMQELFQHSHLSDDKVKYFPYCKRFKEFVPPVNSNRVLCFGRQKDITESIPEIARECPDVFFIVFPIGSDVTLPNEELIPSNVEYRLDIPITYVSDSAYYECGWILFPYVDDLQPGYIIDAYAHSRPVIGFEVGTVHDLFNNGKTGFWVPKNKKDELISMIKYVAGMPYSLHHDFCQYAYEWGKDRFDASKVISILFLPESTQGIAVGQTTAMDYKNAADSTENDAETVEK